MTGHGSSRGWVVNRTILLDVYEIHYPSRFTQEQTFGLRPLTLKNMLDVQQHESLGVA
jgi:hypothetical protein